MNADGSGHAVLHVGAPKTGSTFLQGLFWRNRTALAGAGVEILGHAQAQHYRAGKDLRDIPFDPADPGLDWTGAWGRMADRAATSTAPVVVVSDEHLAAVTAAQAQRAVASLAPRQVHVVYVVRDLVELLPSEWQEFVKHGSTLSYDRWAQLLFDSPSKPPGAWFWSVHDPASVVERWTSAVPLDRMHVLAMPAATAPRQELWTRFASVTGVDPAAVTDFDVQTNASLGPTSTEVLRRVNEALPSDFPHWYRTSLVRDLLANEILQGVGDRGRPALTPELTEQASRRADDLRSGLAKRGVTMVGQRGAAAKTRTADPVRPPTSDDVANASVVALAALMRHMAEHRDRDQAPGAGAVEEALANQQAQFWSRHPISARLDRLRDRALAAADTNSAAAAALDRYRRLRARPAVKRR